MLKKYIKKSDIRRKTTQGEPCVIKKRVEISF